MVHRFVNSKRYDKALQIKDSAVTLEVKRWDPLLLHAEIQGSGKNPYIVVIDVEGMRVGHACPDFTFSTGRRHEEGQAIGWCKHLAKVLMMLPEDAVDTLYHVAGDLRVTKGKEPLQELLEEARAWSMDDVQAEDMSLRDRIHSGHDEKDGDCLREDLIAQLDQPRLMDSLWRMDILLKELQMAEEEGIGNGSTVIMRETLGQAYEDLCEQFVKEFWTTRTVSRIDAATLLKRHGDVLGRAPRVDGLTPPKDISPEELADADIVLHDLGLVGEEILGMAPDRQIRDRRVDRWISEMQLRGSPVLGSLGPVTGRDQRASLSRVQSPDIQDLMINVLETSNEARDFDICAHHNPKQDLYYLPPEVETRPGLTFVLQHITMRPYLTPDEVRSYSQLFRWLLGEQVVSRWRERPRTIVPTNALPLRGFIVQWDFHREESGGVKLHAMDQNDRLVLDQTSPISWDVQPFDLTLCEPSTHRGEGWQKVVKPVAVITPDQAVRLVRTGIPIISNCLPWDILQRHAREGYTESGEVSYGIHTCQERFFIYGAGFLQRALADIARHGAPGMSEEAYRDLYLQLDRDTGRLNPYSRAIVRRVISSEGTGFKVLVGVLGDPEDQLKQVFGTIATSPTLDQFRNGMMSVVTDRLLNGQVPEGALQRVLAATDLRQYEQVKLDILDGLTQAAKDLKTTLGKGSVAYSTVARNPVGHMILASLQRDASGNVPAKDREDILEMLERLEEVVELQA